MAELISVHEAWQRVAQHVRKTCAERIGLAQSLGRVMYEAASGSQDVPAYDKSLVDGIAIRYRDLASTKHDSATVEVVETIYAGQVPTRQLADGQAARIMTGAPMPVGGDSVVMVEKTFPISVPRDSSTGDVSCERVSFLASDVRLGQHVMVRGAAYQAGLPVVPQGRRLRAVDVGVLAELGCHELTVHRRPRVTLIQTGDELVSPNGVPGPGQIRNSNGMLLEALVRGAGGEVRNLGIVRDTTEDLRHSIEVGLGDGDQRSPAFRDVVILCGGVSAGEKDFVPQVLADCGVECVFHKVNVRPGKPLWFGITWRDGDPKSSLVFGLPGNPVSGLVGFILFVAPALSRMEGDLADRVSTVAELATPFTLTGARPAFWPARIVPQPNGRATVEPLVWRGSADPFTLVAADCLVNFPTGDTSYPIGSQVECLPLR